MLWWILIYFHILVPILTSGLGSMGPIAASFGESGIFCAIDASGKQVVICWDGGSNSSSSNSIMHYSTVLPPIAALSGGEEFMCGILVNTSQIICWDSLGLSQISDLVPDAFKSNAYSHLSAGKDHACAVRGSYYSESVSGNVDCWDILKGSNNSLTSKQSTRFNNQNASMLAFRRLVSGDGFSCGIDRDGQIMCWGPNSVNLGISGIMSSEDFVAISSGLDSICGVSVMTGEVQCWGNINSHGNPPSGIKFVSLAAGELYFCGIREDNHGIECWGHFNASLVPKGSGFLAIASSNFLTCGVRESDLVLDCWFANSSSSAVDVDPPLQLCSPGLCSDVPCEKNMFAFNASLLNEPDLTSLCVRKELKICSPCGLNCSEGFFPSSPCDTNADRVCTSCSLCQNSWCWDICGLHNNYKQVQEEHWDPLLRQLLLIIGSSLSGLLLLILATWWFVPRLMHAYGNDEEGNKNMQLLSCTCIGGEPHGNVDQHPPASVGPCPGVAQVFRLSELKDATNGFKEFNVLGRGSYGFVYKALLPDGRQAAVKRANAATIIHSNSRDFEMEVTILCNVRHANIVNLLGYCAEMGERLLVYEFMPNGTLHDHLHGGSGLSCLNWSLRLKIAMQAARGLEYLHKEAVPPIAHRDVRSTKILLDADWGARICDFGILTPKDRDLDEDLRRDVHGFGVVLLEILSGRKSYDEECDPSNIVDWALPHIRLGKAAAIFDPSVTLPKNVEPLYKLADVAEFALREDQNTTTSFTELAHLMEQLVKDV